MEKTVAMETRLLKGDGKKLEEAVIARSVNQGRPHHRRYSRLA